jgi:hypothetical protein
MNGLPGYDAWKLASPDDEGVVVECNQCGERWPAGSVECEGCGEPDCPMVDK